MTRIPNQDLTYWNLKLSVVWSRLHGTIEEVDAAKEVFFIYKQIKGK